MNKRYLDLSQYDYDLPPERIAQTPLSERDRSRLLVLNPETGLIKHHSFPDILNYLSRGDVLVLNDSRVRAARLYGRKPTGGRVELLLLEEVEPGLWEGLVGGRRLSAGRSFELVDGDGQPAGVTATIAGELSGARRQIKFDQPVDKWLDLLGGVPLPPYIAHQLNDGERYQTVYARHTGSAAAPTAGLHFTPDLLLALREKGVLIEHVTLHIGLDTFKPVESDQIDHHPIHSEWATLTAEAAERINRAKLAGGRVVAVGTTSVRTLETAALRAAGVTGSLEHLSRQDIEGQATPMCAWKPVIAFEGRTDLYIYPGYKFRVVDAMLTNFHMPKSTLMMLVSAFAGRENIQRAYQAALKNEYRFLSLGDAMLII